VLVVRIDNTKKIVLSIRTTSTIANPIYYVLLVSPLQMAKPLLVQWEKFISKPESTRKIASDLRRGGTCQWISLLMNKMKEGPGRVTGKREVYENDEPI